MAARRLIAVMLVLLFLSSLAAALAPVGREPDEETTTTTTPLTDITETGGEARLVRGRLDAGSKRPAVVRAGTGDQLQLRVTGRRPGTVELVGLGATEDLDPEAPALFDVLLDSEGRFPVEFLESGRRIGTIRVSPRVPREPAPPQAPDRP